jgi:uncharacterized protein (TIGR02466 family)
MIIHSVFPTAVLFEKIGRDFTDQEKAIFEEEKKNTVFNTGNRSSKNNYILEKPELASLKEIVTNALNLYMSNIESPKNDIKLRITQSWLNYTEKGEHHHQHRHPNSYLSGVLYINAKAPQDKIYFYRNGYKQIELDVKEYSPYNSSSWYFEVESLDLVIFPSHLEHMVVTTENEETRVSLAFNAFLSGVLGDNAKLTELILE